jgi:aspartate/methionine/tyrosine aminotransferase
MNIDSIKPTAAIALADIARTMEAAGKRVIKLQTGDPDFSTHSSICEAATNALKDGHTHYSFSQGLPKLRELIADSVASEILSPIKKEQVVITNGAVQAISAIISALIEPGDEVLIFEPNWPTIDSLVILMGGKPVKINTLDENTDVIEALDKAFTSKTKMLCFNSPNNPTGVVLSQCVINIITKWAIDKKIYIVADEVYRYLQFVNEPSTSIKFLKDYDKYIFVDSFSKKFAMTGWRIGYCISSEHLVKKIGKASQLTMTNVAPFVQFGAIAAITNQDSLDYSAHMKSEYNFRRDALSDYCKIVGLEYIKPEGAFYMFVKLPLAVDDIVFSNILLNEFFVCTVPGSGFGISGSGYIRVSYANELNTVMQGLESFQIALKKLI